MHSRSPSPSAYEGLNPGQQQHVGGAMTADHFHINVGSGPATKRVNTTGRLCSRNHASSSCFTSIVSRPSGTSRGAPTLTKSVCMSTTITPAPSRPRPPPPPPPSPLPPLPLPSTHL